jgi:hypothetical protein
LPLAGSAFGGAELGVAPVAAAAGALVAGAEVAGAASAFTPGVMICAPACIPAAPELPGEPEVVASTCEVGPLPPPALPPCNDMPGFPAPGFSTSVAETVSVGGFKFGCPACAAPETFGLPLSMPIGDFSDELKREWCSFV